MKRMKVSPSGAYVPRHAQPDKLLLLPDHLLLSLFDFLDVLSLARLACCSTQFRRLSFESARLRLIYNLSVIEPPFRLIDDWQNEGREANAERYSNIFFVLQFVEVNRNCKIGLGCGVGHSLVLNKATHKVYSFGDGSFGQLAQDSLLASDLPQPVQFPFETSESSKKRSSGLSSEHITQVEGGPFHSLFLTSLGRVYASGEPSNYRLGLSTTLRFVQSPTLLFFKFEALSYSERVVSISCGCNHGILLTAAGKAFTFGKDANGALGQTKTVISKPNSDNSNFNSLPSSLPLAQDQSSTLVSSPITRSRRPKLVSSLSDAFIISASAGTFHSLFLANTGVVYSCGKSDNGRLGLFSKTSSQLKHEFSPVPLQYFIKRDIKIMQISTRNDHSFCVTTSGEIFGFGSNLNGRLGLGETWLNQNVYLPQKLDFFETAGIKVVKSIAGESHSCVISAKLDVYTFGPGTYGKLGHPDSSDKHTPTKVVINSPPNGSNSDIESNDNRDYEEVHSESDTKIVNAVVGDWHTILAAESGKIYAFGGGWFGRLGHNNHKNVSYPKVIKYFQRQHAFS